MPNGFVDELRAMWSGPGHLRFLVQPTIAIILGIVDGRREAKRSLVDGREPVRGALRRLAPSLTVALLASLFFQWIILGRLRPLGSLLFAILLVALPYAAARAIANRAARRPPRPRRLAPTPREA